MAIQQLELARHKWASPGIRRVVTQPIYHQQLNVTMAAKLKGNLLIHGGLDENVNPSATFKLSEALIKAGKISIYSLFPVRTTATRKPIRGTWIIHWNHFIRYLQQQMPLEGLD